MRYSTALFLGIYTSLLLSGCGGSSNGGGTQQNLDTNLSVNKIIANQVQKYDLPAMGIIIVDKNSTISKESVGVKQYASEELVTDQSYGESARSQSQ